MFTQKWRQYWGLTQDPFSCEDADKDQILGEVDAAAVHSSFDRLYGNPRVPAPGIVFGEKGSGKSGLRLMMRRRLEAHDAETPGHANFVIEYIDFDNYIERLRLALGASRDADKAAKEVFSRWETADHLDAILSLGVTNLVDRLFGGDEQHKEKLRKLPRKQRVDLLLLTALYHDSTKRTKSQALDALARTLHVPGRRANLRIAAAVAATLVGAGLALLPIYGPWELGNPTVWFAIGVLVALGAWAWALLANQSTRTTANRAFSSLRVLPREPVPLAHVLDRLPPKERAEFTLPIGTDDATRYDLLSRFLGLLEAFGYDGCYVLMDRVDEPTLLSGHDERMRRFVEKILDIKLLQFPRLALKLFLPIEMETIHRNASPEDLKRMRLDKSNFIPELKWTGQELYEIADQRLQACLTDGSRVKELSELFEEGFDLAYLRDTLTTLGTPRYAFGFLSAAFLEYVRELENDLPENDPRWRLPRGHFQVVRAGWIDRTGVLRRSLN